MADGKMIRRDSLSKQVSDRLEALIASGAYPIGHRIPTEPELMEMFQVSRNTVREAVQSLTWAGLLDVRQGDGTYVRATDRFYANMNQKYEEVSLENIRETRICLEATIAHLSALRRSPEDIQCIEEALSNRENQTTDRKENSKADVEFHLAIAEACHNRILIDLYRSLSTYLESQIAIRNEASPLSQEEIDSLHTLLFQAIRDGDPTLAAETARQIPEI